MKLIIIRNKNEWMNKKMIGCEEIHKVFLVFNQPIENIPQLL